MFAAQVEGDASGAGTWCWLRYVLILVRCPSMLHRTCSGYFSHRALLFGNVCRGYNRVRELESVPSVQAGG